MGLNAGTAFIDVQPNLSKTFAANLGGKLTSVMPGLGTTAGKLLAGGIVGGAAVAGTALVGLGSKGVAAFGDLQRGINEVATLLPNLDAQGLENLTDDVQGFAREAGLTTDQVIPALYQAISAGVPPDNVFDFLETANKAAVGGVSDIETAVDGLTSVVNAYGSDVISTAEASDLMFTAVRLGKTDFDQLSRSLFNVIPTASGLGVEFSDVTGALAALTAQGTPTNVATTQLRQALTELGKEGSKVDGIFRDAAGQSFREFIASGGDLNDALGILQGVADDTGKNLTDMFGSVEAGNAVLGLTSESGAKLFNNALGEMGASAGATDQAFETMDQGIGRSWERIKASFQVALTEIGERLAPFVETVLGFIADKLPGAIDFLIGVFETLSTILGPIFDFIGALFGAFRSDAEDSTSAAGSAFGGFVDIIKGFGEIVAAVFGAIQEFWAEWGDEISAIIGFVAGFLIDTLGAAIRTIQGIIETILGIITGDWSRAWEGVRDVFGGVWDAIKAQVELVFGAVSDFIGATLETIRETWTSAWRAVRRFLRRAWETIEATVRTIFAAVSGFISSTLDAVSSTWSTIWGGVRDFFAGAWETIETTARNIFGAIQTFISSTLDAIAATWSTIWEGIKTLFFDTVAAISNTVVTVFEGIAGFFGRWWAEVKTAFANAIEAVIQFFRELPGKILAAVGDLWSLGLEMGKSLVSGILGGLGGLVGGLKDKIGGGFSSALSFGKSLLGIRSPSAVFRDQLGLPIAQGIAAGIENTGQLAGDAMSDAMSKVLDTARGELAGLGNFDTARADFQATATTTTAAAFGNVPSAADAAGLFTAGPSIGTEINLAEGAVQVINPEPEPASLTVPRELRRLATTLGRG